MLAALLTAASVLLVGGGRSLAADFPPFLIEPERFPAEVREEVASVWRDHTLTRVVSGEPARVPLELFQLFVDTPEVTTAASRHLGLGKQRVRRIGSDLYEADDGEGAVGTYRVLLRQPHRRILLTRGSHESFILGRITGATLTLLTFAPESGHDGRPRIAQRVETFVRIDNPVAAFVARAVFAIFSGYADRKVAEAFNVTVRVSAWAYENAGEFCRWLAGAPELARYRAEFAPVLAPCG